MKLKKIHNDFYILSDDVTGNVALVYRDNSSYVIDGDNSRDRVSSKDELLKTYGIRNETIDGIDKINKELNGYPVKQRNIFDVKSNERYSSYLISQNSKTRWVAGYWAVKFNNGYTVLYCPKEATVLDNKSVGPFKDKFVADKEITILNKKD